MGMINLASWVLSTFVKQPFSMSHSPHNNNHNKCCAFIYDPTDPSVGQWIWANRSALSSTLLHYTAFYWGWQWLVRNEIFKFICVQNQHSMQKKLHCLLALITLGSLQFLEILVLLKGSNLTPWIETGHEWFPIHITKAIGELFVFSSIVKPKCWPSWLYLQKYFDFVP